MLLNQTPFSNFLDTVREFNGYKQLDHLLMLCILIPSNSSNKSSNCKMLPKISNRVYPKEYW